MVVLCARLRIPNPPLLRLPSLTSAFLPPQAASVAEVPPPAESQSLPSRVRKAAGRVLIFTMDSISAYEDRSKKGGAAGEIIIRRYTKGLEETG